MFSIGLSEIVLPVKDVKSAARFYQEVVGLIPDAAVSSWKGAHEDWASITRSARPCSRYRLRPHLRLGGLSGSSGVV